MAAEQSAEVSDPLAQMKFCLHRFAHTTEEAQAINATVDREVAAATPTPMADLDVERLAEAIGAWWPKGGVVAIHSRDFTYVARRTAAEYARLATIQRSAEVSAIDREAAKDAIRSLPPLRVTNTEYVPQLKRRPDSGRDLTAVLLALDHLPEATLTTTAQGAQKRG